GFPHHPVVHHEGYPFAAAAAAAAAAATRCGHEENPYFHGWLISSHPEMSPPDYSMALSYSPEYANGAPGMDHSHYGGVPPGNGPPGLGGPRPLRECIPTVPADTKLSKIKTLRLATSYIAYLMDLLAKDDQNGEAEAFKAEIKKTDVKEEKRKKELNEILKSTVSSNDKKTKGRTGWPQHVWALELKQ
ncbi:HAND2 protein, partial [Baryphthengus martii]|nr:HAND2 protein [Baryphthengus martii]